MRFFLWQIRCLKTTKRQREISNNSNSKIVESYQFRCKDVIRSSFVKMSYFEVNKVILGHLRVKKRDLVVFGSKHVISGQFSLEKCIRSFFVAIFDHFTRFLRNHPVIKFKSSISNNSNSKIVESYQFFQNFPILSIFFYQLFQNFLPIGKKLIKKSTI